MLNIKEVVKTVNGIISKNSKKYFSSLILQNAIKPNYNNGINQLKICSLGLESCKKFYSGMEEKEICERKCPFGFLVCKKSFNTSTQHKKISIFSIIDYQKVENLDVALSNLPRGLKKRRPEVIVELEQLEINSDSHRLNKEYIEGLVQTLLIGRIGLSIQSISHQFFTPLQGAMSDVKNIESNSDVIDSIARLSKNFNSLNKLATEIQLILSTSQEFNKNMLRRVTVHSMVNEIYSSLESNANEKNIELRQGFNDISKTVEAIPSHINIVLSNILSNAIKYSYKGHKGSPLKVNTTYSLHNDEFLLIRITNQGCKITDEEIRERLIFNLSYRGVYSDDRQRAGSGSGLYVSNEIIKAHGGKIEATSVFLWREHSNGN